MPRWLEITDGMGNSCSQRQVKKGANALVSQISGLDVGWLVDGMLEYPSRLPFCTYVRMCKL